MQVIAKIVAKPDGTFDIAASESFKPQQVAQILLSLASNIVASLPVAEVAPLIQVAPSLNGVVRS